MRDACKGLTSFGGAPASPKSGKPKPQSNRYLRPESGNRRESGNPGIRVSRWRTTEWYPTPGHASAEMRLRL
jgi:hypothetical protein